MKSVFETIDVEAIKEHGLTEAEVQRQLNIFKRGIPFVEIVAPAALSSGIEKIDEKTQNELVAYYERQKETLNVIKFVPASGAATRMFQFLHEFLAQFDEKQESLMSFLEKQKDGDLNAFFGALSDFAFSEVVFERLKEKYPDFEMYDDGKQAVLFVTEMLHEEGLDFGRTPKGLIPFHKYESEVRTAFAEQLYEAVHYIENNGKATLHFTISEAHLTQFESAAEDLKTHLKAAAAIDFDITFSFQNKSTDTVAATVENTLFVGDSGKPVFRPAGHGALLENLNAIDADLIFVKNIDNVVPEKNVEIIGFYKKVLAGRLLQLQEKIFAYVVALKSQHLSDVLRNEITEFIRSQLYIQQDTFSDQDLLKLLDRPIRVCGVVKNTGAPGGGPFLVRNADGTTSYQIVERSEIDQNNAQQQTLADNATHFNPVDLVCGVRNYRGKKFDLMQYANPDLGFISEKSHFGTTIKALERPGLWNGSMAYWTTLFVEVPLVTFNPVKKVVDLLEETHQNQ